MAKESKRDEVLRRLLRTPPKPHDQMTKAERDKFDADLKEAAKELGLTDPNEDFGSDAWKKRHGHS